MTIKECRKITDVILLLKHGVVSEELIEEAIEMLTRLVDPHGVEGGGDLDDIRQ